MESENLARGNPQRESAGGAFGISHTAAKASAIPSDEPKPTPNQAFDALEAAAPQTTTVQRRGATAKTIRLRDKEHCKFVATRSCVVCGRTPAEAHHIRFAQPHALGRKVSDEYTVPVCRIHHRELHRYGDEASWWTGVNIDPLPIALDLWQRSRSPSAASSISSNQTTAETTPPSFAQGTPKSMRGHWI
jgi:hypothetical protein